MRSWHLVQKGYLPEEEGYREALFTLGNGYFATRGAAPECIADGIHYPGTYLAGGYNRLQTEMAGRIIENEDLVNLPNWLPLQVRVLDGPWFHVDRAHLRDYCQRLDTQHGIFERDLTFIDDQDRVTRLLERRLVHMRAPHLAAIELEVVPENWSGTLEIRTALDGTVVNANVARYKKLASQHLVPLASESQGERLFLKMRTSQSGLEVAQAARTRVYRGDQLLDTDWISATDAARAAVSAKVECTEGGSIRIEKIVALYTSRDRGISEPGLAARETVDSVPRFADLIAGHKLAWQQLWRRFGTDWRLADGQDEDPVQLIVKLHVFHLLQSVSMNTEDLDVGIPARGWHGEGYRGHIFWDELFIFPLLNLRIPEITRALLKYRARRLQRARRNAEEAGFRGAMFPWQSGSDGREETQQVHLNPESGHWLPDNSSLQRHVNIAIAYNIWQYHEATGDEEFLAYHGAEMFLEIARFLVSLTTHDEAEDRYDIHGVMGPDEYHEGYPDRDEPGLDNNTYTNVMTVWVLERAQALLAHLSKHRRAEICKMLELTDMELAQWDRISRRMRVVFHRDGILSQFEGYEDLEEFDWNAYRGRYGDIQRLDRILEAEGDTPNRYKLSKQSDVLMLFYLLSAEELTALFTRLGYQFDPETIVDNINYYLNRTSHGSSLSRVVHSWVLARSDRARSWQLFQEALMADLDDSQKGTTAEGIHLGAMAGSVDILQRCYTGIETRGGALWINPALPADLDELSMRLRYRHHLLILDVGHRHVRLRSLKPDAGPITVRVTGRKYSLAGGETLECAF
ncbi:MAG: glycosyl hydrolase family 65 protein [Gammaproteobacteria bacterium]|jgi:alpha,alpha-trehalase